MKAFLFPGQGSQRKGMGAELFQEFGQYVRIANDILGYDIVELCVDDPDSVLTQTEFTQPAVFVVSALSYLKHLQEGGGRPDFVAGHSVGEYAAFVAAGALDFESALTLVKARGEIMSRLGNGRLAAVIGHDEDSTLRLIKRLDVKGIELANLNTPVQTVVGGSASALEDFVAECSRIDVRAIPLQVGGAFHTSLMSNAAQEFRGSLEAVAFRNPVIPVISNVTGQPYKVGQISDVLGAQIDHHVNWVSSIAYLVSCGVTDWQEFPAGGPLKAMVPKIAAAYPVGSIETTPPVLEQTPQDNSSFQSVFGCDAPIVFGGFENAEDNRSVIEQLGQTNIPTALGSDGRQFSDIEKDVTHLEKVGIAKSKLGLSVSFNPFSKEKTDQLIEFARSNDLGWIQLRGFRSLPDGLVASSPMDDSVGGQRSLNSDRRLRIVARVNSIRDFEHFLSEKIARLPDAIAIDVGQWRSRSAIAIEEAIDALKRYRSGDARRVFGRPVLIGLSGTIGDRQDIDAAIAAGFDFVIAESIFQPRRDEPGIFRAVSDWQFPEFGSRTLCRLESVEVANVFDRLDEIYQRRNHTAQSLDAFFNDERELSELRERLMPGTQSLKAQVREVGALFFQKYASSCEPIVLNSDTDVPQPRTKFSAASPAEIFKHLTYGAPLTSRSLSDLQVKENNHESH